MGTVIFITVIYAFIQFFFYIRKGYIRELLISLVLILISCFYMVDVFLELNAPRPSDFIEFIFRPVAELIFDIKE